MINKDIQFIILSFIISISVFTSSGFGESVKFNPNDFDLLTGSWIKEIDGVTILFVSGSHYQMGYQYGYHLRDEIIRNCRAFFYRCPKELFSFSDVLFEWMQITNFSMVPKDYRDEVRGLLDGLDFNNSQIVTTNSESQPITMFCSGISAWGSATEDGKLIHFRSLDSPVFKDPVSETYVHDHQVLLIRNPDQGYLSLSPSVAGDLGLYGGFNEEGIAISWVSGFSDDIDFIGVPLGFRLKMALDYAGSSEEVMSILQSNRTNALSYIISNAKIPIGYVNEQTASYNYVGTWDNPSESQIPFWSIDNIVRRTNIFINKTLSSTQRTYYNPSFFPYLMSLFRLNQFYDNTYYFLSNVPSSGSWIHYEVLSKELDMMHGEINKINALPILQRVYSGRTNIRYAIATKLFDTGLDPWNQWTAVPETGDISISFAKGDNTADKTKIHQFNLYDLIE
jgi:hypothetical protein